MTNVTGVFCLVFIVFQAFIFFTEIGENNLVFAIKVRMLSSLFVICRNHLHIAVRVYGMHSNNSSHSWLARQFIKVSRGSISNLHATILYHDVCDLLNR